MKKKQNIQHPRLTEKLIGHQKAYELFSTSFKSNIMPHAWLISGQESIGKASLIYKVAGLILNDTQKVKAATHPDLMVIELADDKSEITIDQIREVNRFMSLKPALAENKVVIIDPIDKLNANAANALLKITEEPPANSFLFLVSHAPDNLLPTIVSRCNHLKLPGLSPRDVFEICKLQLPNESDDTIKQYMAFAQNSPGLSIFFHSQKGIEYYHKMLELAASYPNLNMKLFDELTKEFNDKEKGPDSFKVFTYCLGLMIQKLIRNACLLDDFCELNEKELIAKIRRSTPTENLLGYAEKTCQFVQAAQSSHLEKKHLALVLLNMLGECCEKY